MKISKREKRLVLVGGVAVLAYVAFVYVVEPFVTVQLEVRKQVQERQALLERHRPLASERARYRRKVQALEAPLRQAETLLLRGDKVPLVAAHLQGFLHELGKGAGLAIVRENVPPPREVEMLIEVPVELSLRGGLKSVRDFLYRVQTAPHLLTVPKLVIRRTSSRGGANVAADLRVAGYMLAGPRADQ